MPPRDGVKTVAKALGAAMPHREAADAELPRREGRAGLQFDKFHGTGARGNGNRLPRYCPTKCIVSRLPQIRRVSPKSMRPSVAMTPPKPSTWSRPAHGQDGHASATHGRADESRC